jgi:hypothetical protein
MHGGSGSEEATGFGKNKKKSACLVSSGVETKLMGWV